MSASERDTGRVTDAPPPPSSSEAPPPTPPPPPASPPDTPSPPPLRAASKPPAPESAAPRSDATSSPSELDLERLTELAGRWYGPLLERDGWVATLYLLVGTLSSIGFFVALLVLGVLMFGLLFIVIGILLIRPFFALAEVFASAERAMAGWVGTTIEARPVEPMTGLGFRAVADGERWRHVGFVLINVIIGSVIGNVGLVGYTIALQAIPGGGLFGFDFDPNPFTGFSVVFSLTVAAVVLGAAPRIAVFIARFKAQITQWFLGIDELEVTRQRVDTLSTQRDDILDAVAGERRRIERNLHDGVQQQLVAIGLDLGMAEQSIEADPERTRELITNAREKVRGSIGELRQLGRGLHPAVLADRGIDAALSAVVAGAPIPISVHVADDLELPTDVAETAYFVANEAVANVLKHSEARVASIQVTRVAANVRIAVHDDGVGGVDPSRGSGIAGIRARVQAVDGTLTISSPPGGPTMIVAEVPRNPPNNRDEGQIDG